ncbi:hypothetical protein V1478_006450 [Vespula squamosa]|uniref:Ribosomal protein S18 n=1 Tax=Vespula squamosa TaxID=30214 RepID=A0ABD2B7V7_VESSQ
MLRSSCLRFCPSIARKAALGGPPAGKLESLLAFQSQKVKRIGRIKNEDRSMRIDQRNWQNPKIKITKRYIPKILFFLRRTETGNTRQHRPIVNETGANERVGKTFPLNLGDEPLLGGSTRIRPSEADSSGGFHSYMRDIKFKPITQHPYISAIDRISYTDIKQE